MSTCCGFVKEAAWANNMVVDTRYSPISAINFFGAFRVPIIHQWTPLLLLLLLLLLLGPQEVARDSVLILEQN